eukprot:GHVL01025398.1.p1 GENE.GHVL01025398.1~~GHVL01025398.1.p1  ORF type:complete len:111 (+),score=6.99 GHVL01025398.1:57-389(+)
MKVAVVLSLAVVLVAAVPSKRFISIHDIEHGLHHLGHEIEHGLHHIGEELEHVTGLSGKDLACKIYPHVKDAGEGACDAECVVLVVGVLAPLCPPACHVVFHEADKLANC